MKIFAVVLLLSIPMHLSAQLRPPSLSDPCGIPDTTAIAYKIAASGNWGYGYDTLLIDLARWKQSPFVTVDSIGASVQKRTLFMITITDSTADTSNQRKRIWIHARTHPNEVQGTWVTNEMIRILLTDTVIGPVLRKRYVYNIVPMYNPDGVELKLDRQNANGIDIESNWNAASPQQEVLVLRSMFQQLMARPNPIRVMLNMHSSVSGARYFVYHTAAGTSTLYAALEERFINYVRSHFLGKIQPLTFFVSWTTAPATQYPESWFWFNHHESVLAITYEDINGTTASAFDSTAYALLRGSDDFLRDTSAIVSAAPPLLTVSNFGMEQNYPNPFNGMTNFELRITNEEHVKIKVFDPLGREVSTVVDEKMKPGRYHLQWNAGNLPSGIYFYCLEGVGTLSVKKMILLR